MFSVLNFHRDLLCYKMSPRLICQTVNETKTENKPDYSILDCDTAPSSMSLTAALLWASWLSNACPATPDVSVDVRTNFQPTGLDCLY